MNKNQTVVAIIAIGPIWICFVTFILQLCSFAIVHHPSNIATIVAFFSVGFLPILFGKDSRVKYALVALSSSLFLFIICFFLASWIYDTSHDGQKYQQFAVSSLESGWDFYRVNKADFKNISPEYLQPLLHYPKFAWLLEASLFKFTGRLEGAKELNILLLICSGLLTFLASRRLNFSIFNSLLLAIALALNPVSICQLWTFYNDGLLASTTLLFFATLSLYFSTSYKVWAHIAGLTLVILLNIKFTSLVIVGSIFFLLVIAALRKFPLSLSLTKILLGYLFFGITFVGWHPYLTNFLSTGNPIYPVAGYSPLGKTPEPTDWPAFPILQGQQPISLNEHSGPKKTLLSVASRVADPFQLNGEYEYFWESKLSDYSRFVVPDLRLGGFGPIYPLALVVSIFSLFQFRKDNQAKMLLSVCSVILLSCLLNPESWWSRYSPQLWMLPILIGATCKRHQLLLGICLALALNSFVILFVNTRGAYLNSSDVKNTLNKLAPYKNSTLPGSVEDYYANKLRLSELNIRLTPPEGCSNKVYFAGSTSFVCLP